MTVRAARPMDALLALAASVAAIAPMLTLFDKPTWLRPALLVSIAIVLTGMAARTIVRSPAAVAAAQALVGTELVCLLHGRGHLWHGLPTVETFFALNYILYDARVTVMTYAAPAPMNRGLLLATTIIVAVVVWIVDVIAVSRRAPAAAGLTLLAAYLLTATNSGSALPWYAFVLPAGLWLTMLARSGVGGLRRWATAVPLRSGDGRRGRTVDPADSFAAMARNFGIVAIAGALMLPLVIPHLPTRFLGEGLGRSNSGTAGGSFELSSTLDLTRNLEEQSDRVVLRYRTGDPSPGPLRLAVLRGYDARSQFFIVPLTPTYPVVNGQQLAGVLPIPRDTPAASVRSYGMSVTENNLSNRQLPLPDGVIRLELPGDVRGTEFSDGVIEVDRRVKRYDLDFRRYTPQQEVLQASDVSLDPIDGPGADLVTAEDYVIEPQALDRLTAILAEIVPAGATDLEAAVAIQDYLRGPEFTYSLTLAGPAKDENGRLVNLDPVSQFLLTKTGFCQQFATAMIMLARQQGIPARMVIGFLPGTLQAGERTIRGRDAHAWPELFFENVGWLRFEPTPAGRTGTVPQYAHVTPEGSGTPTSSSTSPTTTTTPRRQPGVEDIGATAPTTLDRPVWQRLGSVPTWQWALLGMTFALLATVFLPIVAARARRRRLRAAEDDAARIEAQWFDLVRRIGDLGLSVPTSLTPRQTSDYLRQRAALSGEPADALNRVVSSVEQARYAPRTTLLDDPRADVDRVLDAVGASRTRGARLRAWLLPRDGVLTGRRWMDQASHAPGRVARSITSLLPRR